MARRQEEHFNKLMTRKLQKSSKGELAARQKRKSEFREKMRDKFSRVGTRVHKMTRATVGKRREKFDPTVHQARGGVVLPGNLIRVSGKGSPSW